MNKKSSGKTKTAKGRDQRIDGARIPIQLLVDYRSDGSYLFDFCRDLGTGGIFIETKQPKSLGSTLDLVFTIPDSKETLNAKGRIIWVQEPIAERPQLTPGMGIQFEEFASESRATLAAFVERYSKKLSKSA